MTKIRTRMAPSPTGYLHVGSLHTFLFNDYFTKQQGGELILRVEDTDRTRYVEGAIEALISTLHQMGIVYSEGPILLDGQLAQKGNNGPYIQSQRLDLYQQHARQLVDSGHAYYCFCSKERLSEVREQQQKLKQPTKYDRHCLLLNSNEIATRLAAEDSRVIRMKVEPGKTTFRDEIRGDITIDHDEVDDQVLLKADGFPTYHLAVVVDDHLMGITHIIRAEEWISSVPKHLMLYDWFGFPKPVYAHLPLILNPDKSKLSKRQGDVSVESYLEKGFLKEALLNFVGILGFNPSADKEIYSQEELIKSFDIKKVSKSGPVFDVKKLLWMNGQYVKNLSVTELVARVKPFLKKGRGVDDLLLERICEVEKSRLSLLSDIDDLVQPYRSQPIYDPTLLIWKNSDQTDALLQLSGLNECFSSLTETDFDSLSLLETTTKEYIERKQLQNGNVLWPLRVALCGRERSAGPFELAWVLGKQETVNRIKHAIQLLS